MPDAVQSQQRRRRHERFDDIGEKLLAVNFVIADGLLKPHGRGSAAILAVRIAIRRCWHW
jgi:hypothetical protein